MVRIQNALRDKCPSIAVGLYRAAREIWPFENTFGESNIDSDRELIELRQIFYTDLSTVCNCIILIDKISIYRFQNNCQKKWQKFMVIMN
jgi:hypothetical protein